MEGGVGREAPHCNCMASPPLPYLLSPSPPFASLSSPCSASFPRLDAAARRLLERVGRACDDAHRDAGTLFDGGGDGSADDYGDTTDGAASWTPHAVRVGQRQFRCEGIGPPPPQPVQPATGKPTLREQPRLRLHRDPVHLPLPPSACRRASSPPRAAVTTDSDIDFDTAVAVSAAAAGQCQ